MSKIYDALVHAAKSRHSRTAAWGAIDRHQRSVLLNFFTRKISLDTQITGAVATVILVFGALLLIAANQLLGRALRNQVDQRALAITNNLSHAAAGLVIGNNILELYASLTKYSQLPGVAYAFIEDGSGKIIAHSIRPFPTELVGTLTADERKQVDTRVVTLQGKIVYETRVPILEGQRGAAHLGIWAEDVTKEINTIRFTFVVVMGLLLLIAVAVSVLLVRTIILPIVHHAGSSKPTRAAISSKVRKTASQQRRQRTSKSDKPKQLEKSPSTIEEPAGEP